MRKLTRFGVLLLVTAMVLTAVSCNAVNATTAAASSVPDAGPPEVHYTFTLGAIGNDRMGYMSNSDELAGNIAWLYEKFNFDFEIYPLTWDNYIDQTRLWLASKNAPDLMMLDVAAVRYPEFVRNVKDGLFRPYTGYENYPNLKEKMDTATVGKKFIIDGELWAWPGFTDTSEYNYYAGFGAIYRKDWAQAVGLYKEDMVYTWDEWYTLVQTVVEQDPGENGSGRTIGLMSINWMMPKNFGPASLSPYMLQYGPDAQGGYTWGPFLPESLEAVKLTNQMYKDGLIWVDQMMVQDEDPGNKFKANLLFAKIIQNLTASSLNSEITGFMDANPEVSDWKDVLDFAFFEGPDGKILSYQGSDHWSQEAMNADLSDEKAERWMMILDYLVSEEGYYFRNLGIPGIDFEMVDGDPVCLWTEVNDAGVPRDPYSGTGASVWRRLAGNSDNFSKYSPSIADDVKDIAIRAMDIIKDGSRVKYIPIDVDLSYYVGMEDANGDIIAGAYSQVGTMEEDIYNQIAALLLSNDVEKDWSAWLDSKRPLVQPAIDEINEALRK